MFRSIYGETGVRESKRAHARGPPKVSNPTVTSSFSSGSELRRKKRDTRLDSDLTYTYQDGRHDDESSDSAPPYPGKKKKNRY